MKEKRIFGRSYKCVFCPYLFLWFQLVRSGLVRQAWFDLVSFDCFSLFLRVGVLARFSAFFTLAKTAVKKSKVRISLLEDEMRWPQSRDMIRNDSLCSAADDIYIEASQRIRRRPLSLIATVLVLLLVFISSS